MNLFRVPKRRRARLLLEKRLTALQLVVSDLLFFLSSWDQLRQPLNGQILVSSSLRDQSPLCNEFPTQASSSKVGGNNCGHSHQGLLS